MKRRCSITGRLFSVSEAEQSILQQLSERNTSFSEPFPLPRICPAETVRRAIGFANLRFLFYGNSTLSNSKLLARYNPADGYKTVTPDEFWSDSVDNTGFGRSYDFRRPFHEQFNELLRDVVHIPLNNINCERSDFVNGARNVDNCYLCFSVVDSRDCLYCVSQYSGNDNVLCVGTNRCQFCYAGVDINECYECQHCSDCDACSSCMACIDCHNCKNCIGCTGLDRESFCIFNERLSKADYAEAERALHLGSWQARQAFLQQCFTFQSSIERKPRRTNAAENCTGSYIRRSENLVECYHTSECRDCAYLVIGLNSRDCWKGYAVGSENCYNAGVASAQNVAYSYGAWDAESIWYSYNTFQHCRDCFGCAALKGNSYCILNKQYSKSEYFDLLPRIARHMKSTGEWGDFILPAAAPHSYEESWIPAFVEDIDVEERIRRGYRHREPEIIGSSAPETERNVPPDDICQCRVDDLAGKAIRCETTEKLFNLQRRELEFYQRLSIPLPRIHWSVALSDMIRKRDRMPDSAGCLSETV